MKSPIRSILFANLVMALALLLSACGAGSATPTPTLSLGSIQTAAVGNYLLGQTQTALALPSSTPTATPTASLTPSATVEVSVQPTVSCYGLTGVSDVTIPDGTPMVPGQAFTKTWQVRNSGTCAWAVGFRFSFIGGDAMSGVTLVLSQSVAPGAVTNLSVPMIAPNKTGSVRGNWRMSNSTGVFFGDEEFVIISLGGTPTFTPTATQTPTGGAPTNTPTATPTS